MGRAQNDTKPLLFSPAELRQVLSVYSDGVMHKGWRDYAIEGRSGQSLFSVVDHGFDGNGAGALFSLSKNTSAKQGGAPFYRVFEQSRQILRTESFLEALSALRQCGQPKSGRK